MRGYIEAALALTAERNLETVFMTPPARNFKLKHMPSADRPIYLKIAERFAAQVLRSASERGCGVIDLFGATRAEGEEPKHDFYIDGNHVRPSAFLAALSGD